MYYNDILKPLKHRYSHSEQTLIKFSMKSSSTKCRQYDSDSNSSSSLSTPTCSKLTISIRGNFIGSLKLCWRVRFIIFQTNVPLVQPVERERSQTFQSKIFCINNMSLLTQHQIKIGFSIASLRNLSREIV